MTVIRIRLLFALFLTMVTCGSAYAQVDLIGTWVGINNQDATDRGGGPRAVDYTGIPLNEEGRAKALSYSPSVYGQLERQCVHYNPSYTVIGPFGFAIQNEFDGAGNTVAIVIGSWIDKAPMTIWMDGRPHPSKNAQLPVGGFTTGVWEGDTLVTTTTHMKASYLRRNGTPTSDASVLTMYFVRHGDLLTVTGSVEDPIYLTEPFVLSKTLRLGSTPMSPVGQPCQPEFEGVAEGSVPHFLPGQHPTVGELTKLYGIPQVAALGGAATMYPEFRKAIKDQFVRPEKCTAGCAPGGGNQLGLFQPVPPFPATMSAPAPSAPEPPRR
jgi:hypothetical protein